MSLLSLFADGLEDSAALTRRRYPTPLDLGVALDPETKRTPALELVNQALVDVADGLIDRVIISMSPQEGKSQLISRRFCTWCHVRNPDLRIGLASYEFNVARRWGRFNRNDIRANPQLGLKISDDTASANEWTIEGRRGGMITTGIAGALTSRPLDMLVIDDPVKDRPQAESEAYRDRAWEFWTDVARPRLAPGAPVVLVMTRWHEDDLAGRLINDPDGDTWTVINIPAQADHDPGKGETDLLGRAPGEWMISARGRTTAQWEQTKLASGARTFAALYQGRPAPVEGDVLKRQFWKRFDTPKTLLKADGTMWCPGADEVIQSWDMAFKDTDSSDYVVGQVWARFGADAYLIDQVRGRWDFPATVAEFERLTAKWPQAKGKLVEEKANGAAVISQVKKKISGIIAVNPKDSKESRTIAISPYLEAGNLWVPSDRLASWAAGFINEAAGFPNAAHDDQVDACTQAVTRLLNRPQVRTGLAGARPGVARLPAIPLAGR